MGRSGILTSILLSAIALGGIALTPAVNAQSFTIDFGDDSGEYPNDGECDDPRFEGPGVWDEATDAGIRRDASDCRAAAIRGKADFNENYRPEKSRAVPGFGPTADQVEYALSNNVYVLSRMLGQPCDMNRSGGCYVDMGAAEWSMWIEDVRNVRCEPDGIDAICGYEVKLGCSSNDPTGVFCGSVSGYFAPGRRVFMPNGEYWIAQ